MDSSSELPAAVKATYTTDTGTFAISFRKNKRYRLRVAVEEFLMDRWKVLQAPVEVTPDEPVTIIVERMP